MSSLRGSRKDGYLERHPRRGKRLFTGHASENKRESTPQKTGDTATATSAGSNNDSGSRAALPSTSLDTQPKSLFSGGEYYDRGGISGVSLALGAVIAVVLVFFMALAAFAAYSQGLNQGANQFKSSLDERREDNAPLVTDRYEADLNALAPWLTEVEGRYYASRKIAGISIDAPASDQTYLGLYENTPLNDPDEASTHFFLGATRGDRHAAVLLYRTKRNLGDRALTQIQETFENIYTLNGGYGFDALGDFYSGAIDVDALLAYDPYLYELTQPDLEAPLFRADFAKAFRYYHMATLCNVPNAYVRRNRVTESGTLTAGQQNTIRSEAETAMAALIETLGVERESFCSGSLLKQRLAQIRPATIIMPIVDNETGGTGYTPMSLSMLALELAGSPERFASFIERHEKSPQEAARIWASWPQRPTGIIVEPGKKTDETRPYAGADGSPYYRDNPGGGVPGDMFVANEANIDACRSDANSPECRKATLACGDNSAYFFNLGEADMARGNIAGARDNFSRAIANGRMCASDYAVMAGKRLAALNLTCEYSSASLAEIARNDADSTQIIDLKIRQNALKALGHYRDTVDGSYGPKTRDAITSFQREFGFRETGDLTALETVYLICGAAELARNVDAYTTLGLMYVVGHGVSQNTDMGLQWLKRAARDGDGDAMYNLALIYGSGIVLGSYQVCDVPENIAQADAYLVEAARSGHPVADRLIKAHGHKLPDQRWDDITGEMIKQDPRLETGVDRCAASLMKARQ